MTLLSRHPDAEMLTRAADDELAAEEAVRVHAHVAECAACADEVTGTRALGNAVRAVPMPLLAPDAVERALARRAAGERVLLPADDVTDTDRLPGEPAAAPRRSAVLVPPRERRTWTAAAALTMVALGAWWALSPGGLEAAPPAERLRIVAGIAQPGGTVTLEYAALPALAGQESLLVRAVASRAVGTGERSWRAPLVVLHRASGRTYRAGVRWPSAVAVTASVELADGSAVDANSGELFHLLATDERGALTFEALVAGVMRDRAYFDSPGGHAASPLMRTHVVELERRFADRPETWALSAEYASSPSVWDAWFGSFARRTRALERLDRDLSKAPMVAPRARRAMLALANAQEEPQVAAEWAQRVGRDTVEGGDLPGVARVDEIVRRRDVAGARAFLRDSMRTSLDFVLALRFGTFDHVWAWGADHAPLVPCDELQAAFDRAHAHLATPRRPLGVPAAAYAAYREHRWTGLRTQASLCGVPRQVRSARYVAWSKANPGPAWEDLRAIVHAPLEQR